MVLLLLQLSGMAATDKEAASFSASQLALPGRSQEGFMLSLPLLPSIVQARPRW